MQMLYTSLAVVAAYLVEHHGFFAAARKTISDGGTDQSAANHDGQLYPAVHNLCNFRNHGIDRDRIDAKCIITHKGFTR